MKEDLPGKGMVSVPDLLEVHERIHCSKEGAIEPSTTLGDEFRNGVFAKLAMTFAALVQLNFNLPGTSVSPLQFFTYFNTHLSSLFATNSQQRIRSSAKYILAVNTSAFCP